MRKLSVCLIIVFISAVAAQQNPTITFITKEIVADIGGTVELKCSVQFVKDFPVSTRGCCGYGNSRQVNRFIQR